MATAGTSAYWAAAHADKSSFERYAETFRAMYLQFLKEKADAL